MRPPQASPADPFWRTIARRAIGLVAAFGLVLSLADGSSAPAAAQEAAAASWERVPGTNGTVVELIAPSSGALLATTTDGLYRSDDGGNSWHEVSLPARAPNTQPLVAIDPTNHDVIYARGTDGLSKTTDGGATWSLDLPSDAAFPLILSISISPADPNLIHLIVASHPNGLLQVLRSADGGATWPLIEQYGDNDSMSCYWTISFVQWHPTDASRLFRTVSCAHGVEAANLQESRDQGATWSTVIDTGDYSPLPNSGPRTMPVVPSATPVATGRVEPTPPGGRLVASPQRLIGGIGPNSSRFYLAMHKDYRGGGSSLLRTDDDGQTWTVLFDTSGGGTATPANDQHPNITIGGIAYDPSAPDTLYAAFAEQVKGGPKIQTVRQSTDAGATWTDVGTLPVTSVYDLAFGIDGANLYAATDQGIWRLNLR